MSTKNLSNFKLQQPEVIHDVSIGILVSQWNKEVTEKLLDGALTTLKEQGISEEQIHINTVPGSYELPLGAQMMIEYAEVDAVICLGSVIQGETRHFEFISQAVSQGLNRVSLAYSSPVIFGVLTTANQEQALDRAGGKHGNKGVEAAVSALEMLALEYTLLNQSLPNNEDLQV
ncbi:MAG: 6,7-dimethyl-8-ribityllumazine synthase [Bacteroidales bacterium]